MYSLGCTFYYLLAGVAPFPGGDITDKLTRHAKNPPPDIRDLRPDLPVELTAILLKLMAKRPEDRFATYDELTAAIVAVPLAGGTEPPGVTFAPVSDSADAAACRIRLRTGRDANSQTSGGSHSNGSADASIPLVSLAELAAEDDHRRRFASSPPHATPLTWAVIPDRIRATLPNRRRPAIEGNIPGDGLDPAGCHLFLAFVILGIGVASSWAPTGVATPKPRARTGSSPRRRSIAIVRPAAQHSLSRPRESAAERSGMPLPTKAARRGPRRREMG